MKRSILLASALMVLAVVLPSSASAWTPKQCADWYATHGSNHPDCQWYVPPPPPPNVTVCVNGTTVTVPENQVPEGSTPGECAPVVPPPPAPPEQPAVPPTPPVTPPAQPPVTTVPDTHDVEVVVDEAPQADIGTPVTVRGKEEEGLQPGPENPEVMEADTSATLPYTGFAVLPVALLGLVLLAGGRLLRRQARQ